MAYMNQEMKKELAPAIKEICKKHGIKATLGVRDYSQLVLNIKSGSIDFDADRINEYWYHEHFADNAKALAFLSEVIPAMNIGNFDKSDVQTDYFHVGWYISVNQTLYGDIMIMFTILFLIFIGMLFVADLEKVKKDKEKLK